jgi:hypothetical protein
LIGRYGPVGSGIWSDHGLPESVATESEDGRREVRRRGVKYGKHIKYGELYCKEKPSPPAVPPRKKSLAIGFAHSIQSPDNSRMSVYSMQSVVFIDITSYPVARNHPGLLLRRIRATYSRREAAL